ncbi:PAS domain S-box-containing protein/diguanylate cyclase (GGDEF) domain-containing protein [Azotobacter beijerinckii]|uniref:PAS domain S-box-containing protein/diguanylate cyclase (GGDEF) domain-containing protein n=1 Tax=Azotobacter beijerinckii TaxID=170623 RepID=A0A1H6TXA2_9GAMM|nr:GGDEF domain-containing phosphodiesterase [Azotobacter beijerinckii]SEI84708.1 PAS domain S-box-containing protein/diguanylate cyclase (GGDEF) domain-containing protein [Azotobacter beijerinckii]SEJ00158.1 PAS domain S-box-containing protein/diguanylate cyclase (GGDEF) domain-containing protein [Azotobacter beijerinckii]
MATDKKTVRLLILEDSQNEAERLVSLFRNAGRATRVHRLTSSEDLADSLQQTWDLLIAAPHSENLSPAEAIAAIRRQAKDIPILQLLADNDSDSITEALALGAQDALPQGEDERLILVANRELANLNERRARRSAEVALREAEKRCQLLLDSSVDAIAYVHDGMHIYANRAYLQLFGYEEADELEGMPMIDLIAGCDQTRFRDFLKNYDSVHGAGDLQCSGIGIEGRPFRLRLELSPASYDGEPCIQAVLRAESLQSELEEKLREVSCQDLVTGLFNRNHFLELLDGACARAVNAGQPACLAYLTLDYYAQLHADLGLAGLDQLLADLAALLRGAFSADAQLARFADDAFAVLLSGPPEQARDGLAALLKKVEGHLFEIAGRTVQLTLSIGVAGLNETTPKAQAVIERAHRCADQVVDGNALKLYDPAEELAAEASRGNVAAMVRQALEKDSFRLLFQPIISLRGDNIEHYEVLLRLIDPQGAQVPPADFLAAASEAGLAETVDRWVILNAIRQLAAHRANGHDTRLFVHLSAASLQDPTLLPWLGETLRTARLPAAALILQLDETDATTYLKQAKSLLEGLAALHGKSALIHFGCALNPFNTLRHLPVDYVKIDDSYTHNLTEEEGRENLKVLLAGLHAQAKPSIVPGIESSKVLATLWQAGVNYIQGYYLQAPGPALDYDFPSEE